MRPLMLAVAIGLAGSSAGAATPTDNPQASTLDKVVETAAEAFFASGCHVGLSVGIHDAGGDHVYNYGTVSKTTAALPTGRTLYEIGSVTKTFTGTLAARAILDGKMTLNGDFRAYLSAPYPNLMRDGKPITLRTLASHKSGMPRELPDSNGLFKGVDADQLPYLLVAHEKTYDRARYLKDLHDTTLATTPGDSLAYSNIGIKLVAFGLENVYSRTFDQLLKDEITGPLGMKHTSLHVSWLDRSRLANGYGPGGGLMPHVLPNAGAAGGLYSDTQDMLRYAGWQLDETNPVVRTAHEPIAGYIDDYAIGMMWDETRKGGERKLWHSGGVYGMSSQLILFPDAGQAYVLLANDGCFDTQGQLHDMAMTIHAAQKGG